MWSCVRACVRMFVFGEFCVCICLFFVVCVCLFVLCFCCDDLYMFVWCFSLCAYVCPCMLAPTHLDTRRCPNNLWIRNCSDYFVVVVCVRFLFWSAFHEMGFPWGVCVRVCGFVFVMWKLCVCVCLPFYCVCFLGVTHTARVRLRVFVCAVVCMLC